MISQIKKGLYFPIAAYFKFFAQIQLLLWKPRIIVITGSNGKTTLLHLIESQLGDKAKYSHHANSAYGIPFNILGLERKTLTIFEWPLLFILAPFKAFKSPSKEKIYVVEADCDRPNEGKFLATLLNPEVTIWLSISKTHSINFNSLESIAYEFGYFLKSCTNHAIINGDNNFIIKQLFRTKASIGKIHKKSTLNTYQVLANGTKFVINDKNFSLKYLLPEDTFYSIAATISLLNYLNLKLDNSFKKLTLPPGRTSIFRGIRNTTIIDSSYNATPASVSATLNMFKEYPAKLKWAILSDMVELGKEEKIEHQKIAKLIIDCRLDKVILMGPRMKEYTLPKLKEIAPRTDIEFFLTPKDVLKYLKTNIKGGETLFFKGARFLEGVIEHLLKNKADVKKLCRREKVWIERRKKWGL